MIAKRIIPILLFSSLGLILSYVLILDPIRVVVSDSMSPTLLAGDILWIKPVSGPIPEGMIVSYDYQGKLITHRVANVDGSMLTTKGDNNQKVDPWLVPISSVVGSPALRIPYLGYLIRFIQRPLGWTIFIILPAGWIVCEEIKKIVVTLRESKSAI